MGTHQIKCMLESYKVDGTFDGATADKCNGELNIQLDIGYPEHIPRSKPATPEFGPRPTPASTRTYAMHAPQHLSTRALSAGSGHNLYAHRTIWNRAPCMLN